MSEATIKCDVIVVGAGPAGCAAALALAERGREVILVERAPLPQHKTCGDVLLPDALRALTRFGVDAAVQRDGRQLEKIRIASPASIEVELAVRTVSMTRPQLHAALHERVCSAGVKLLRGEVLGPLSGANGRRDGVRVRLDEQLIELHAPLVILATGARHETLKQFGVCLRETPTAVAIRGYYRDLSGAREDVLRISCNPALTPGFGWVVPLPDNLYNIGCGHLLRPGEQAEQLYLQKRFEYFSRAFAVAARIVAEEDPVGAPCGWVLRTGLSGARFSTDGVLVAGEAAGTSSPLIGAGVGKALATGELAGIVAHEALSAGCFDAAFLGRYEERLNTQFGELYRSRLKAEKWLRSPDRLDLLIKKAVSSATVRAGLEAMLNQDEPPTKWLSYWKLFFA